MQCPNDQTALAMTERQGIEIDYCPTCRGVWLDRGELDKLMAAGENPAPTNQYSEQRQEQHNYPQQNPYQDNRQQRYDDNSHYKKKRKESFLGDLFDF